MSNYNNNPLDNLGLGAPIGGGSSTTSHSNTFNTSSTSAGAPVGPSYGGAGSREHVHDDKCGHAREHVHDANCGHAREHVHDANCGHAREHVHDANCGHEREHIHDANCGHHQSSSGLTSSSGERNTTSGDQGIGRGSGGTTAFESDASRVGENRAREGLSGEGHQHGLGHGHEHGERGFSSGSGATAGLTGAGAGLSGHHHTEGSDRLPGGGDLRDREAGIMAGLGAGHHDQSVGGTGSRAGLTGGEGLTGGSGLTGSHGHHTGAGVGAGVAAGAVGAGGIGLTGREATRLDADGVIGDSVTGQRHFADSGATGQGYSSSTSGAGYSTSGVGAGAGLGAGAAGLSHGQGQGQGVSDRLHGQTETREEGPLSGLKQELKEHQSGHGAEHPESKGPHGLVWHNGKYVHERELSGHGSTGVPLR